MVTKIDKKLIKAISARENGNAEKSHQSHQSHQSEKILKLQHYGKQ